MQNKYAVKKECTVKNDSAMKNKCAVKNDGAVKNKYAVCLVPVIILLTILLVSVPNALAQEVCSETNIAACSNSPEQINNIISQNPAALTPQQYEEFLLYITPDNYVHVPWPQIKDQTRAAYVDAIPVEQLNINHFFKSPSKMAELTVLQLTYGNNFETVGLYPGGLNMIPVKKRTSAFADKFPHLDFERVELASPAILVGGILHNGPEGDVLSLKQLPKDATITTYKNGDIDIVIKKPSKIESLVKGSSGDFIVEEGKGNKLLLPAGELGPGALRLNNDGTLKLYDRSTFTTSNLVKIEAVSGDVDIYFESFIYAPAKPDGNYVAVTDDSLEIGSAADGQLEVKPQPGNELFNMVHKVYFADKKGELIANEYAYIADERDSLTISVGDGDSLTAVSREAEGKIPLITHHDGNGMTAIATGRFVLGTTDIRLADGKITVNGPEPYQGISGQINMQNSVAFELASDSPQAKDTLIISSSNRYVLLRNGKEVSGTDIGLEVSDQIEQNMIKRIDDLKVRYPGIEFALMYSPDETELVKSGFGTSLPTDYVDITANMAQTIDQWLRDKQGIDMIVSEINFNTMENAVGFSGGITIGERVVDPSTLLKNPIRDIDTALKILDHELDHVLDNAIMNFEMKTSGPGPNPASYTKITEGVMSELAREVYTDAAFKSIIFSVEEITPLTQLPTAFNELVTKFSTAALETDPVKMANNANNIFALSYYLNDEARNINNNQEVRAEANRLKAGLDELVAQTTGLYPYSFLTITPTRVGETFEWRTPTTEDVYFEALSTYSELPAERARQAKELAQLELDRAHSLGIKKGDEHYWIVEEAENRCRLITGKVCQPCTLYKLTCKP